MIVTPTIEKIVFNIPKESYDSVIKDGFVEDINNYLLDKLGDCVMRNLVAEGEIVVKLLELYKEEFAPTNSIQFNRQILWKPLVRCKECKHLELMNNPFIYAHCHKWGYDFEPWGEDTRTNFCSWGERRADEK